MKLFKHHFALLSALLLSASTVSCNLFGSMDEAQSSEDLYAVAVAKANEGDCVGARDILGRIEHRNDDMNAALGWAELCITGATARNIALSLYSYTSSSTNYTVIGTLARTMLPVTAEKTARVSAAINAFSLISDGARQNLLVAIAQFVKAAATLGAQAINGGDSGTLEKSDIGGSSCDTTTCSLAFSAANCTSPMTNGDVSTFSNAISAAATALQVAGATDLKALADAINSNLIQSTAFARCFIHNQTLPP